MPRGAKGRTGMAGREGGGRLGEGGGMGRGAGRGGRRSGRAWRKGRAADGWVKAGAWGGSLGLRGIALQPGCRKRVKEFSDHRALGSKNATRRGQSLAR